MKEAFRRMNTMAYQLEQAYAEGILDKEVLGKILDVLEDYIDWYIQYEQYRQLQDYYKMIERETQGSVIQQVMVILQEESEEDVMYREYIKSLPEGL
ncbi:MAG TPA: hypothetical protein PLG09_03715 [Syntrophomonadaceae bacterium]|nr:hypothetical protein [Syntrophomonadaceae bacterium]HOQ09212.1 hypothetical protein [Syntrophomonadaceae bacterium]HPU48541.1 hypothetical protein [Syntrophomonadaceae bacterium]